MPIDGVNNNIAGGNIESSPSTPVKGENNNTSQTENPASPDQKKKTESSAKNIFLPRLEKFVTDLFSDVSSRKIVNLKKEILDKLGEILSPRPAGNKTPNSKERHRSPSPEDVTMFTKEEMDKGLVLQKRLIRATPLVDSSKFFRTAQNAKKRLEPYQQGISNNNKLSDQEKWNARDKFNQSAKLHNVKIDEYVEQTASKKQREELEALKLPLFDMNR